MKTLHWVAVVLLIAGGLNWGLIGLFNYDFISSIFGLGGLTQSIYILIGASAVWRLYDVFITKK